MADEEKKSSDSEMSTKDMIAQDLKTVDQMARWRKKIAKGENIKVKVLDKGMMPVIMIGDSVEVQPIHAMNLRTNHIVFYRQGENFLVRRIVAVTFGKNAEFTMKGDSLEKDEPIVQASQIIGKVIALERDGQRIDINKNFGSAAIGKLKQLGSMKIGSGKEAEPSKQMDYAKNMMNKGFEFAETAHHKLCEFTDKLIENLFNKKR
ncbi:MAG: hypothetical protein AB9903_02630 [Vulcanimicrobiota bacterium]